MGQCLSAKDPGPVGEGLAVSLGIIQELGRPLGQFPLCL